MVAKAEDTPGRGSLAESLAKDADLRRRGLTAVATLLLGLTFANPAGAAGYDATLPGSLANTTLVTGAQAYWAAGYTGKGVDVAVIDTGVAPVNGLTAPGKVVNGIDVSFDASSTDFRHLDGYGHGTHMSSIIAGRDDGAAAPYAGSAQFVGMAPDARVLSVKVGDVHGAVDVSQVIAAIDWVVAHRKDNGLNVRVLNLSYGTDSVQDYQVDPLMHAVENAWKHGIAVVVATGNDGDGQAMKDKGLASPARHPRIIAVGAADTKGTLTTADDTVASFSTIGGGVSGRNPDLVAPGVSIAGLKVPGSVADVSSPNASVGDRYIKGSGSSQAAAVVSGAAALIIQQRPSITPDQLRQLLRSTATPLVGQTASVQGRGELDLRKALGTATQLYMATTLPSTGIGSLELARGTHHVAYDGVELTGEKDVFGRTVDTTAWAAARTLGTAWNGGSFNGTPYAGDVWTTTDSWTGFSWKGFSWRGYSWTGFSWTGFSWRGFSWNGFSWTGLQADETNDGSLLGFSWRGFSWSSNGWK